MVSQNNVDRFKQNVIGLLLFCYNLSVQKSIDLSQIWFKEYPTQSWSDLYQLLKTKKVILKQGMLSALPQLSSTEAGSLATEMQGQKGVEIKNRWYNLKCYPNCFIGSEAVEWLKQNKQITQEEAIALGQSLLEQGLIHHTHYDHDFKDEFLFYCFTKK